MADLDRVVRLFVLGILALASFSILTVPFTSAAAPTFYAYRSADGSQARSGASAHYALTESLLQASSPLQQIILPVPDGAELIGTVDRVEAGFAEGKVLIGHIGDPDLLRRFFLAIDADGVAGSIETEAGAYAIGGPRSNFTITNLGRSGIRRFAPDDGASDGLVVRPPPWAVAPTAMDDVPAPAGDVIIDVLAVGNLDFLNAANSSGGGIYNRLNLFFAKTNQAYRDSGIHITVRMVKYETYYPGSNAITAEAANNLIAPITSSDHTVSDFFANLRNSAQADVVIYFRKYQLSQKLCGSGFIGGVRDTPDTPLRDLAGLRDWGYATVSDGKDGERYCDDYTTAHELGHILGSKHDHLTDPGAQRGAYNESFGLYVEAGTRNVTTIMGYAAATNPFQAPIFSNPELTKPCLGMPCGVRDGGLAADNVRRFNDVRFKVANWYGPKYVTLRLSAGGEGEGTVAYSSYGCPFQCAIGLRSGTDVTITASPAADSAFVGWSGACSGSGPCKFTLSEDRQVVANFSATVLKYRLTVSRGGGGVGTVSGPDIACGSTCTARYLPGTMIVLRATGDAGYEFAGWDGACAGQPATCRLSMIEPKVTTARFKGRRVTMISARGGTSYAVRSDQSLWAWGNNDAGQYGTGDKARSLTPKLVGSDVMIVEAGWNCTYAIKRDNSLWAWGSNEGGKLGDGTEVDRLRPVKIGDGFLMVSAGTDHAVALKIDGTVWAWGRNLYGQLGTGNQQASLRPIQIGAGYSMVSAAGLNSTGVTRTGALMSWGANISGEVGDGGSVNRLSPVQIGTDFAKVYSGFGRTFAIKRDGSLWAWGGNQNGEVGNGNMGVTVTRPVRIGDKYRVVAPAASVSTGALAEDSTLWSWGWNYQKAAFGDPTLPEYQASPRQIGGHFLLLASASDSTYLAVRDDGSLWAWGTNENGGVGDGSTDPRTRPVLIMSVN